MLFPDGTAWYARVGTNVDSVIGVVVYFHMGTMGSTVRAGAGVFICEGNKHSVTSDSELID